MMDEPPRRTSPATVILILIGIAILGAVGYDAYLRGGASTPEQQPPPPSAAAQAQTQQLQAQLQDALARVQQSDQRSADAEGERVMWMTVAKAAAGVVGVRPPTLYSVQRAVFGSGDPMTRQFLRDYFKKPENIDKVSPLVVFVAGLVQPGAALKAMAKACDPLFMGPLPDMAPKNADALWCYEFLKRRQAEGGDLGAWQKMLAAASAEMGKKS